MLGRDSAWGIDGVLGFSIYGTHKGSRKAGLEKRILEYCERVLCFTNCRNREDLSYNITSVSSRTRLSACMNLLICSRDSCLAATMSIPSLQLETKLMSMCEMGS
jgi:hypothetical protein